MQYRNILRHFIIWISKQPLACFPDLSTDCFSFFPEFEDDSPISAMGSAPNSSGVPMMEIERLHL
ncbi:MAG: hypothetical protein R2769_08550 [Saprospiraceae bacterium]